MKWVSRSAWGVAAVLAFLIGSAIITGFSVDHIHSLPPLIALALLDLVASVLFVWVLLKSSRKKPDMGDVTTFLLVLILATHAPITHAEPPPKDSKESWVLLCVAIIGTVTIGYMTYKIYKCAKQNIPPPSPTPPPPPPPPQRGDSLVQLSSPLSGEESCFTNTMDGFDWWTCTESGYGNDWEGNPWDWCFSQTITNLACGTNVAYWQASSDLRVWINETYSVTGYVSAVQGTNKNMVAITYDCRGVAFATNWLKFSEVEVQTQTASSVGAIVGVPINKSIPHQFFRVK